MRGLHKDYNVCPGGGGFGPVCDDGYGISYLFYGEDTLVFHVTSSAKCPKTVYIIRLHASHVNNSFIFSLQDAKRMSSNIFQALQDIKALFSQIKD